MKAVPRLRIALQKSGRLNNDSLDLLYRCGLQIRTAPNSLLCHVENLPIDILFVRDDDIPTLVMDNICDLGIVGENVLNEQIASSKESNIKAKFSIIKKLGFCRCRLSIAVPADRNYAGFQSLAGKRIATSYPNMLREFLDKNAITAEILTISGSVEIAPRLDMSDAICDLVSSGRTLKENNLKEVEQITQSQAVLISPNPFLESEKQDTLALLLSRIESVLKAQESKYIMFHAPKSSLPIIKSILPGCETPTITTLEGVQDKVAVHVVSNEKIFWLTLEELKKAGASSILVLPIEKMLN